MTPDFPELILNAPIWVPEEVVWPGSDPVGGAGGPELHQGHGYLSPQTEPLAADVADHFTGFIATDDGPILRRHRGDWWRHCGTHYLRDDCERLETEIMAILQRAGAGPRKVAKVSFVRDVLANLKTTCYLPVDHAAPFWVRPNACCDPAPSTLVLQNGILDIEAFLAGRIDAPRPHTPAFFSSNCLPFALDPDADCPRWLTFLAEVLPDPECQTLLQEFFGYCLVHDTSQQKALILVGEGRNGKSTATKTLCRLLGRDNYSAVGLEKFGDRFALFETLGKLANVVSEIGEIDKVEEGLLKGFISADEMPFERKYRDPFTARPTARLIFATNTLPRFLDRSLGIWRRLLIIPWAVVVDPAREDMDLEKKLAAELPGIFLWALAGLVSLRERGHFHEPAVSGAEKEALRLECNPARMFLEAACRLAAEESCEKTFLYQQYREYCKNGGFQPIHEANFGKEVRRAFPEVRDARPGRRGEDRHRAYAGIAYKGMA